MSEVRPRRYLVTLERDSKGRLLAARIGVPIIDDYLRYLAAIGRSPTTWSSYAYDLVVFCRWLTDHQPDHATDHAVEELLQNLTAAQIFTFVEDELSPQGDRAPLALSTVHRRVIALAKFFDWAEVVGIVSRNPVPHERPQGAFHPRQERRTAFLRVPHPLPRPAPIDELASFSKSLLTWRDHALVALLVGSGLRLSEALDLRLSDLDWGGKQVFIRHGKGGRQRYAMVPDSAWAALKAYLETERPEPAGEKASDRASLGEEPVFVSLHGPNRGKRLTSAGAQSIFRHHRAKASTPNVTPHRLRHTCGTELHRAGLSLELIQEQLGHRRLDSTRLYVYLSNERLRQAYQAIQPELYRVPTHLPPIPPTLPRPRTRETEAKGGAPMPHRLSSILAEYSPEDLALHEAYRQALIDAGISPALFACQTQSGCRPEASGVSRLGGRLGAARRFLKDPGLAGWMKLSTDEQISIVKSDRPRGYSSGLWTFLCWLAFTGRLPFSAELLDTLDAKSPHGLHWLAHGRITFPEYLDKVAATARKLGYCEEIVGQTCSNVARAAAYANKPPDALTQEDLVSISDEIRARRARLRGEGRQVIKGQERHPLIPWTTGSILYHLGQLPEPPDTRLVSGRPGQGFEECQLGFLREKYAAFFELTTRYLERRRTMVTISSVKQEIAALGSFFRWLSFEHPDVTELHQLDRRRHIEPYLHWLFEVGGTGRGRHSERWTIPTRRARISCLQRILKLLSCWGWPEAPARPLLLPGDLPALPDSLPKAFDDVDAARMIQSARSSADLLEKLIIELLANCGLRVGEARDLKLSDVVTFGGPRDEPKSQTWLHVPLGKLKNDRYVPIGPELKSALDAFLSGERSSREWEDLPSPPEWTTYVLARKGRRVSSAYCNQVVHRVAERTGVVDGHAHRWRHTFATQAINHGMDLASIATLLGHTCLDMTMVYARIANPKLRQEFERVSEQVQAFYSTVAKDSNGSSSPVVLPVGALGPAMVVTKRELEWRRLGNGWCTRRAYLDCRHELVCERCVHFNTAWLFTSALEAQHEDALHKGQQARVEVFARLLDSLKASCHQDNHDLQASHLAGPDCRIANSSSDYSEKEGGRA